MKTILPFIGILFIIVVTGNLERIEHQEDQERKAKESIDTTPFLK
tara:strand:- start:499 stop:633 length:135 start_codon:yes stop_codon:yes gene_type:complete